MIHISNLSKYFGDQVILSNVSFAVNPGQKVALVGRNGCGKTTLLRMICGQESYDSGSIVLGPACRLGYLGQEGQLDLHNTLYAEMMHAFDEVKDLEATMRSLEEQMEVEQDEVQLQSLLNIYANVQNRYEHSEPHLIEAKIRTVMHGLGFKDSDLSRQCGEFSGGWQMRGAMARMLLREPDMLLLDEPTNHLDIEAVEWLEEYCIRSSSTILLVSHDRYFLDNVVNRTLEMRFGAINDYAGNYSYYLEEREKRRQIQQAAYDNQQKKLAQDEQFIERFRYKATLATRVQSRIKMVEKREKIEAPDRDLRSMKAKFEIAGTSGNDVLTVKKLCKSYGDIHVLTGLDLEVKRGDHMALVGPNGTGKSTLLRLIANIERPDSGSIRAGAQLSPVYYAQHQAEALDQTKTILEEVSAVAPYAVNQTRIRTILGCLLFEGDDVHKQISILSGGERSRVALARCILTPSNLLLLDEPTNHLDITAREALLDALSDYPGTILLVTHDRHFINALANCVVEIRDGVTHRYLGNYDDFRRKRNQEKMQEQAARQAEQKREDKSKKQAPKRPLGSHSAPANASGKAKIKWKPEALEKRICDLEEELEKMGLELADPAIYADVAKVKRLQNEYSQKQNEVQELTALWEELV